jgi:transglutaminase-like putative cysteine protease
MRNPFKRHKPLAPPGSRHGLLWAAGAFTGGLLLNADRVPAWAPVVALAVVAWRVFAAFRGTALPRVIGRTLLALLLVSGVLVRFHTLNGLSAGTALLLLMGSIKLLETRTQRDQFIVVAAAVFLLLAACLDRQAMLRAPLYLLQAWACCAALAIVAYGTPVTDTGNTRIVLDNRTAIVLAARTLAFALPLAALLFVFFPRLPGAFWSIPRSDEAVTGLGDSMSPGSIAELTNSYDIAFRAHFDGPPPPAQERYWRGPVLHEFDGFTWRRSTHTRAQVQPLEYLGSEYHYRVSLEPSSHRWWFALDTPTGSPSSKVSFTYDYQLISADPVTEGTNYEITSHTSTRATAPLSRLARHYDTEIPGESNPRSRRLALELRAAAGSDGAYVDSVLNYLRRGGFEYSLSPPRLGADSVDDFLFDTRLGFCGHYASAFTLLMRAAGVPARVVTGYLGGEWNPIGHYFIVRQSDAHSWTEVWLDGRGWVRVDPTGVVAPERMRRGILDFLPNAVSAPARFVRSQPWLAGLLQRWDALNTWWNDRVVNFNYGDQLRLLERLGFPSPGAQQLGWAFGAGLVGWLLWIAWQVGRATSRPSRPDPLARAYNALCRKMESAGVSRQSYQGPLAFAGEISRLRPDLAADAQPLIARYAQLRYGRQCENGDADRAAVAAQVRAFDRAVRRLKVRAPVSGKRPQSRTES